MTNSNEYMRGYLKKRYHSRREGAVKLLGGCCSKCGSLKKLELDHKDYTKKSFDISKLWNISYIKYNEEIKKCQLLCKSCHIKKTREDLGQENARETHGTLSAWRYCKCQLCREAFNKYMREYKSRVHSKVATALAS